MTNNNDGSNSEKTTIADLGKLIFKTVWPPIHPAGWPFICIFAVVTVIFMMIAQSLGFIGIVLTAWCIFFFRDPVRATPEREGLIISPADGIVSKITTCPLPAELEENDDKDDPLFQAKEVTRISVFLNVFDVHVNRVPIDGTVTQSIYHPGKFLSANLDKASEDNERHTICMKIKNHKSSIVFVQIAGLVARRILCDAKNNQEFKAGERYGIIRFGSRMDIYLPPKVNPMVSVGQKMLGGETVLADLKSKEAMRTAEVR